MATNSGITTPTRPALKKFHFSCGDSNEGPIGFCCTIRAKTKAGALKKLRGMLPEEYEVHLDAGSVDYFNVYFNSDNITIDDIAEELD